MKEEVKLTLTAAYECLLDAEAMLNLNRYKAAVSRSYYAMYHSAKAALLSVNVETRTHQGVNMQFGKAFVKTGIFDKSLTRTFSKMLDTRQKTDYEIGFNATDDDAKYAYSEALNFYSIISTYLNNQTT